MSYFYGCDSQGKLIVRYEELPQKFCYQCQFLLLSDYYTCKVCYKLVCNGCSCQSVCHKHGYDIINDLESRLETLKKYIINDLAELVFLFL